MDVVTTKDEYLSLAKLRDGSVFLYEEADCRYRVETTPVSLTAVELSGRGGWYEYHLPKMPGNLLLSIFSFFEKVAKEKGTEVLVRVYYDPDEESYHLSVPEQTVSGASVYTEVPLDMDLWPVMDIHSHCFYPAFFSSTDDEDEIGGRLYAVIGTVLSRPQILLRAGTGGLRIPLDISAAFEVSVDDGVDYAAMLEQQFDRVVPV